ncbi:MAG: hypothetical protein GF411_20270 [Candidatus Lokiarchaeota archaeon]|nr:hypothetical protein [Candidatus Lokiarchaeota archaeon]
MQEEIIKMVEEEKMSSIQLMSGRVGVSADKIRVILNQLVEEGRLNGTLSEDGERFFRRDLEAPETTESTEMNADFLEFDPRPGKIVIAIGFIILVIGAFASLFAENYNQQDQFLAVSFIGVLIFLGGCYYFGTRRTP